MGVNAGVIFFRIFPHHRDELPGAGHDLADGKPDIDPAIPGSLIALIQVNGIVDGLLGRLLHGTGDGISHIHGGFGDGRPHTGLDDRICHPIHVHTAGFRKSSGAVFDHFQAGQLSADVGILRLQVALKGHQEPRPDHRIFVRHPSPQQLLARMGVTVHQSRHQKFPFSIQRLCRRSGCRNFLCGTDFPDPAILDRHRAFPGNGHIRPQYLTVFYHNIVIFHDVFSSVFPDFHN